MNNTINSQDETTPAKRLKQIRQQARLTRSYIEEKYGLPAATLKAWENESTRLTEKGLKRCIDIYRKEGVVLSKEWILTGMGIPPKLSVDIGRYFASDLQYPLRHDTANKGQVQDGNLPNYANDDTTRMVHEAAYFKESHPNTVIHIVTNDDMEPVYQIGDYVGGIFRYAQDLPSVVKRDCIVRLENGEIMLRRVFKSNLSDHYNLACINPLPTTSEPILFDIKIECAAPVIWHRMPDI